jgi:hypothetical protein
MKHVRTEFGRDIQYICISSQDEPLSDYSTVYIQIILQRIINKKPCFLYEVAGSYRRPSFESKNVAQISILGSRCNYRVTCDDRAWNTFLKQG